MNKKIYTWIVWILILAIILLGVSIISLLVGSAGIPFKNIISLLFAGRGTTEYSIIFDIRLPRIILGFAVGSALALSGAILQGMFRNPLVEPYTLGISGGAALGVCLNIILGLSRKLGVLSLPVFGFIGAGLVILLLYWLTTSRGIIRLQSLLLTGVMISFISSSLVMFTMAVASAADLQGIIFWMMGSLDGSDRVLIKLMVIISFFGLVVSCLFSTELNAMSIGEEDAAHLGINVEKIKKWLFLISSLLTGCAVSVTGSIGFIGLVVPHLMRFFVGRDYRILLPASFLAGGIFLILCDTLARTVISPLELPVGVITGIIGGSLFIYLLSGKRNKYA
ncbi:MAG: iron ABC transporter permease [bacterium]|nr:iron ABC transporter permease [bacterium]